MSVDWVAGWRGIRSYTVRIDFLAANVDSAVLFSLFGDDDPGFFSFTAGYPRSEMMLFCKI
ncbi:hypothetical protein PMJ86_31250 [Pseudomonas aeruginosa]|uniref:hypothetical protein n=1 Tax=Pseudomonas aeruginosa TaxID=287 RepID=UPI00232C47A8|nr:hypothetical protein [Pseudomonas aeruginosa]MDC0850087.1 hypothetical protein [Pseudomonas aeruginosa]